MNKVLSTTALADRLSSVIRTRIACAFAIALRGQLPEALATLEEKNADHTEADIVGRTLAIVFLLHLDRQSSAALAAFDASVMPNACGLPAEIRMILEQNRIDIAFGAGLPTGNDVEDHYGEVDRRKLLGVTFRDATPLLEAAEASAQGNNYDSLPVYSAMLFDAYRQYSWRSIRLAAKDLSRELLGLNNPKEAIVYAILSEEKATIESVADHVRRLNDASILRATIAKVTEVAHLSRHISTACYFLRRLADAIPDDFIAIWLDRLKKDRRLPGITVLDHWASEPAWGATKELLHGATPAQADEIISEVLNHSLWQRNDLARDSFYPALIAAARTASENGCRTLIEAVTPYVLVEKPTQDFQNAIELLKTIAKRSPELKAEIAKKVFGEKGSIRPISYLLTAAAPEFDVPLHSEEPDKLATMAIEHLGFQVERLRSEEKPRTGFGELMIQNKPSESGFIAIKIGSCAEQLQVVATYRKDVSSVVLSELITKVLKTICDADNVNRNRLILFSFLYNVAVVVNADIAKSIVVVAAKFSSDHHAPHHPLYGQEEDHGRLNSFRISSGWPQDVRGLALLVVARLSQYHPNIVAPWLENLLYAAMADPNPTVRRHGYEGVAVAGGEAAHCLAAVVGGMRDADPVAANFALRVVGDQAAAIVKAGLVSAVLGTLEIQYRSADVGVRRAAAIVVNQLRRAMQSTVGADAKQLDSIAQSLKNDVSRGVRNAVSMETID